MSAPEIQSLRPISLRKIWPNEAQDFTPWLAKHIDRLGATVNLSLEQVEIEVVLPQIGRVDLSAKQAETGARVVIENQLGESDDSHCLRLLGYAANIDASILIWVAPSFTSYHRSILRWLNEADNIDIYAVSVRGYKAGNVWIADFQTVIEPRQQTTVAEPTKRTMSTICAEFYKPVIKTLRRKELYPVGKGGYRGRYRSFQSGHADAFYSTAICDDDGNTRVNLVLCGTSHQEAYAGLLRQKAELHEELGENIRWHQGKKRCWVSLSMDNAPSRLIDASEEELDPARQWLCDRLLQFRDTFQPLLKEVLQARDTSE